MSEFNLDGLEDRKLLKVGNLVRLLSGGPYMMVCGFTSTPGDGGPVKCQWFDAKQLQNGEFPQQNLVRINIKR